MVELKKYTCALCKKEVPGTWSGFSPSDPTCQPPFGWYESRVRGTREHACSLECVRKLNADFKAKK